MNVPLASISCATPYSFSVVEDNSDQDLSGQLLVDVTGTNNYVDFYFANTGELQSSITAIYFDWTDALSFTSFTTTGVVDFAESANPGDLPGGNNISFIANWSADSETPKPPKNGINNYTSDDFVQQIIQDSLTVRFAGSSIDSVLTAMNKDDGTFRVGMHLTALSDGKSETYVTGSAPVPEPATMLLFGAGLVGFAGVRMRKKK